MLNAVGEAEAHSDGCSSLKKQCFPSGIFSGDNATSNEDFPDREILIDIL